MNCFSKTPKDAFRNPDEEQSEFYNTNIRHRFIRKVYGIIVVQLLSTVTIMIPFTVSEAVKQFFYYHWWIFYVALSVSFIVLIFLAGCVDIRRKSPMNYFCLSSFTILAGFMLGIISSMIESKAVLISVGISAGVTLVLTIFAFQVRYDFTAWYGPISCVVVAIMFIAGITILILSINGINSQYTTIGFASAGALVFCMYIVFDTQLLLGGKQNHSTSTEEYIFAALNLYVDIIQLLFMLLVLLGCGVFGAAESKIAAKTEPESTPA